MAIMVPFIYLTAFLVSGSREPNCINPLFIGPSLLISKDDVPSFLATPSLDHQDGLCEGVLSGPESCCSSDTLTDIKNYADYLKNELIEKYDIFVYKISDAFSDFDSFNQENFGDEYSEDAVFVRDKSEDGDYSLFRGSGTGGLPSFNGGNGGQGGNNGGQQGKGGQSGNGKGNKPGNQGGKGEDSDSDNGNNSDHDRPNGPGQNPKNNTGQGPPNGPGQNPQNSTGQGPPNGPGQNPQNNTGQGPPNGPGQNPQNNTGQGPPSGPGQNPQNPPGTRNLIQKNPNRASNIKSQENQSGRYRPRDYGPRRERTGIKYLPSSDQNKINQLILDLTNFLSFYKASLKSCIIGQVSHLTGKLCMGCDPYWEDYTKQGEATSIYLFKGTCSRLIDHCSEYVDLENRLNKEIETYANKIKEILYNAISQDPSLNENMFHVEDLFLVANQGTAGCKEKNCENYICNEMAGFSGEFTSVKQEFVDSGIDTFAIGYEVIENSGVLEAKSGGKMIGAAVLLALWV